MIWVQGAALFLLWVAYGLVLRRRTSRWAQRFAQSPRGVLVALASLGLIVPAGLLLGALFLVAGRGGLVHGALTPWAMVVVGAVGLAFVHAQAAAALAMAMLVSPPVTRRRSHPSQSSETRAP